VNAADVTAVVVTRGDVPIGGLVNHIADGGFGEILVWDNGAGLLRDGYWRDIHGQYRVVTNSLPDLGAFGRYAAISYASHPVIYTQDDDCLVHEAEIEKLLAAYKPGVVAALMPDRRDPYTDTVLLGWGALFDRDLPTRAFQRWTAAGHPIDTRSFQVVGADL